MAAADALQPPVRGATHRDADRAAGRDRAAARRSARRSNANTSISTTGCCASHGKDEQVARGAAAPEHDARAEPTTPALRDRHGRSPKTPAFFVCSTGERLQKWVVHKTFPQLIRQVGLEGAGQRARPAPARSSAIPMPSRRCLTGTATARTSTRSCRCCPPPRARQARAHLLVPAGRPRSCSNSSRAPRRTAWSAGHDRARADSCRRSSLSG